MKARVDISRRMPTLKSAYCSEVDISTQALFAKRRPFVFYHSKLREYEVAPLVYEEIREEKPVLDFKGDASRFIRKHSNNYGYQQDAVEFARGKDNVLINFAQGMGKTYTTFRILVDREVMRALVVCGQSNLQEEWMKDARKHGFTDLLDIDIVGGTTDASAVKKATWLKYRPIKKSVDIVNVEALRNPMLLKELNYRQYDCIVIDEVQSVKGMKAQQTIGLHSLIPVGRQLRIALSGTPVLNNPLEFYSVLKFLRVLSDTSRTTFENYYGEWGMDYFGHRVCKGYRRLEDLAELLSPVICQATKDELHLPTKTRKKFDIVPDSRLAEMGKIYRGSLKKVEASGWKTKAALMAEMRYVSSTSWGKMDYLLQSLASNKRMLVFTQYTRVMEFYVNTFAKMSKPVLAYHGKLSMKERLQVLSDWAEGKSDVLFLSVQASRYGLNLTEATDVIFLDIPSSLAVLEQCEDRAHRIGQDKEVVSHLLCGGEIDESMLDLIVTKQQQLERLSELI